MSFVGGGGGQDVHKFVEALQADFKTLSLETKKKYPQIKEVSPPAARLTWTCVCFHGHSYSSLIAALVRVARCVCHPSWVVLGWWGVVFSAFPPVLVLRNYEIDSGGGRE